MLPGLMPISPVRAHTGPLRVTHTSCHAIRRLNIQSVDRNVQPKSHIILHSGQRVATIFERQFGDCGFIEFAFAGCHEPLILLPGSFGQRQG